MLPKEEIQIEQKILILHADGHSESVLGDAELKKSVAPQQDCLPSYLSIGWRVIQMTAFPTTDAIAVLIQRERPR